MANWKIRIQVKEVAGLLLKLEKKKVIASIKYMSDLAISRSENGKSTDDFIPQVIKRRKLLGIGIPVLNQHDSPLGDKKSIVKHRVKKITDIQQGSSRIATLLNPPNTKIGLPMIKVVIFILIMLIPKIMSFTYRLKSTKVVGESLLKMVTITAAGQSALIMLTIYRQQYKQLYYTGNITTDKDVAWILKSSEVALQSVNSISDQFIRAKMSKESLCDYSYGLSRPQKLKDPIYLQCQFTTRQRPNITIIETFQLVRSYLTTLKAALAKKTDLLDFKQFIESQDTAFSDVASNYLMVALNNLNNEYSTQVQKQLDANISVTDVLLAISTVLNIVLVLWYYLFWVKAVLTDWLILKDSLTIMNNFLLNNEYIKSYFKCATDYSLVTENFGKVSVD
jgi:hypothetical protein